jgi:NADPH:quinone reductase-like Zn-dependent oxidoreductase
VTSNQGAAYATKWGANSVKDYKKENVLSQKATYDIVVDLSGKMGYKAAKHIMKPKALFLNPTPKPIDIPLSLLGNLFRGKKHVVILSSPATKYTGVLLRSIKDGLEIEVNKVFPFAQYKEAYEYAERGGYIGKVVIEIN